MVKRFGVKSFPKYALFRKGGSDADAIWYDEASVGVGDMLGWLKSEYGLYVSGLDGCSEEGDEAAQKFMHTGGAETRGAVMAALETEMEGFEKGSSQAESTEAYLKVMKKVIEKGDEYIGAEKGRITKLIDGKVSEDKKKAFKRRLNVLGAFKAA